MRADDLDSRDLTRAQDGPSGGADGAAAAVPDPAALPAPVRRWQVPVSLPLLALLAFCLGYLAIRLALGGALELDEAEIVHLAQQPRLGYGTQPPLYAWLQWLAFEVFGVNRVSLVAPKALLLGASCIGLFHAARPLIGRGGALAASASLALFPQLVWEALRIQTHSVLLTAIAAATLWLYGALLRRPSLARHAGFGLLCALGLQTKYNYGVFLAAILGASLLVPAHRRVLWTRRAWAALPPALLVVLPHAAWVARNPALAFGGTVRKMQEGGAAIGAGAPYLERVGQGALEVLAALVSFVALPALVYAALYWRRRRLWRGQGFERSGFDRQSAASRFFACHYGVCLLLLACLALTGEVGTIKQRWMIPLLFSLPLGWFVMFPALGREALYADIRRVAGTVALCLLALLPLRLWFGPAVGKTMAQHMPYAQLSRVLQQQCPLARTVLTDSLMTAGNVRFVSPALHTVLVQDAQRERPRPAAQVALVTPAETGSAWLEAVRALYPALGQGRRTDLNLALEDGSGRLIGFMIACR
jgi:hypothetical protein